MKEKMLYIGKRKITRLGFFGLGRSNSALAGYIKENYPEVRLILRADAEDASDIPKCFDAVYCGRDAARDMCEDALMLSPSVRADRTELLAAKAKGVLITSETEFFFERYPGECFAISGSDGKSTTTTLTALLLLERFHGAMAVGNIGTPLTLGLSAPAVAAELSSFQLMDTRPRSTRAVITNITKNHLNWHKDYEEYKASKENLYKNAAERVFNYDCPESVRLSKKYGAFAITSTRHCEEDLRELIRAEVYITLRDGYICANGERLVELTRIRLCGEHNLKNLMSAVALTFGYVSRAHICEVAESFAGLAHRNELIGTYGGVRYYNSSIDSSPTRTITTLGAHPSGITLILGGKSKGLDYSPLGPILEAKARVVIIVGENREEILSAIGGCNIDIRCRDSLYDAVRLASEITECGGEVLLSPASTSFDAFKDYRERGEAFTKFVKEIHSK